MDKRKIVRYLLITLSVILGVLVFLSITGTVAHAAGLVDNTVSDANAYSKYPLENYQLDFYVDSSWDWLPWNWLDGIGKSIQYGLYAITNFVWTVSLYISNATGYVVQETYKLDIDFTGIDPNEMTFEFTATEMLHYWRTAVHALDDTPIAVTVIKVEKIG